MRCAIVVAKEAQGPDHGRNIPGNRGISVNYARAEPDRGITHDGGIRGSAFCSRWCTDDPPAGDKSISGRLLVLFFELACIRWFAAYVVFLQFFANVVLIASFLGMSCGCLAARRRRDWLNSFPFIALATIAAAVAVLVVYHGWSGLSIDVGGQASPQEVFFGTEYRNPDVAQFVVPVEAIAATFFVLVAFMFVGPGQVLGRAFDAYPDRVLGYTLNIGGSLAGIACFSALSFMQAPPVAWFFISCAGVAYLLHQAGSLIRFRALALAALVLGPAMDDWRRHEVHNERWSPYYAVDHAIASGLPNGSSSPTAYLLCTTSSDRAGWLSGSPQWPRGHSAVPRSS
jgi:hypothetical protein